MSKRDELIRKYAADIREKLGQEPDMDLLTKVTIGCGPSIYNNDSETIAASDPAEVDRVRQSYLMKKLGLPDTPALAEGIKAVMTAYGSSNRHKYRAVVYYLLCRHFQRESAYG